MRTNGWDMIQGKGNGDARYAFFERRRLIFARRHVFCCRLRRLQDAAALDPVQRLRTAIGRICRAGLADSRARLRRVARRRSKKFLYVVALVGFIASGATITTTAPHVAAKFWMVINGSGCTTNQHFGPR